MPESSKKTSNNVPAISVEHVTVSYGSLAVIDDVSFEIEQGSIAAVIGPNGSGKTTLLRAILGLTPTQSGDIMIMGKHLHTMRQVIGYVPQRFDFDRNFPITVREFMDLARRLHCQRHVPPPRIAEKIKEVGLPRDVLDKHLGELSGGQLQRVLVAQGIINDPAILFLDEPSSGVDITGEATIYSIIEHLNREHNTTVVMVSHDIGMISHVVDTVICINRKMLCFGPPKTALTAHRIEEVFGGHSSPYDHHQHGRGHDKQS
jgi:ABC-type Mn2+/Zn2+ transport system ATPase subunit